MHLKSSFSRSLLWLLLLSLTALFLSGCAGRLSDDEKSEQQLYQEAQQAMDRKRYLTAIERLQALESRFPFGEYGEQAQLELMYAYHQSNQHEAARATASRFVRLNPDHPQVPYALYMRGMSAWEAGRHALEGMKLSDISRRDPGATREAYADFHRLSTQFPDSEYTPDALQRMRYLKNLLAEQEVYIGRFYLRRGAPIAAINRGREVIEGYRDTPSVPDALAVMIEGYRHLEDFEQADELKQLLMTLAPDHRQLGRNNRFIELHPADQPDKTFLQIISFDLIGGWGRR
ncbi:outer membrane protein assembly factor BamD [Marinospirillum alkaliphilum]|uniref:Outer membrane protein assembly factor BamD n=1 Tax=Marinospirillum alkaliphilum DSM 21637 TaxID=1122209 RepID=A0A1K1ZR42_9GAMM|nr:outer membrane protein assembly factor BamD [Marinospirillum alkaliphilum]SFX75941.1 Beta-barrel assembly machine subunit BamD [Marinospirillum alkaliphilum DSM 21637]